MSVRTPRLPPALTFGARTHVMGIVNVTPDSFSGDGVAGRPATAVAMARRMIEDGAGILDVGGQSTRPGHAEVTAKEELERVMSVLPALVKLGVPVSVDTYRLDVARAALDAGAVMVNDIWGLQREPRLAALAAERGAWLVLMHNQEGTAYFDLVPDVVALLRRSVAAAGAAGMGRERIIVDPGFGFGKTAEQNLEILRRLSEIKQALGLPLLLGTSRKSTIGKVLDLPADDRVEGTAATVALGIAGGADIVRVHDVHEMGRVARMADAVVRGWRDPSS